jgi:hypothetical protein
MCGSKYAASNPEQIRKTESLVDNCIVGCAFPLSMVENPYFKTFVHDLDPRYRLPARSHLTNELLPNESARVMERVKSHLSNAKQVALTIDVWTDRRQHSHLGITVHTFVDNVSKSGLFTFKEFKGSHTGTHIASALDKAIVDNKLHGKVPFIVSDNASNMIKALTVLNELTEHGSTGSSVEPATASASSIMTSDSDFKGISDGFTAYVDDPDLWDDLPSDDMAEVNSTLSAVCPVRLSCFAHSC